MLGEDLRPYYMPPLADEVTVGGVRVYGHFTRDFTEVLGVGGTDPQLRVLAVDVPSVTVGAPVIVGAEAFTVRSARPINRGEELVLLLEAV